MRFILAAVLTVVGAAALLVARPDAARAADSAGPAPAAAVAAAAPLDSAPVHPGTAAEERDYAQREAESPEVQEFVGGDCGFAWFILFAALVVVLILYLQKENKI